MKNKARVISEQKGLYKVINENGEFLAKITGKQMYSALSREDYPAVGDWVIIDELLEGQAVIREILPRKGVIKRNSGKNGMQIIAANIDVAFIIESIDRDFNLNRLERYFAIVKDGKAEPIVILNKTDLISKEELDLKLSQIKDRFSGIDVVLANTVSEEGLSQLKMRIENGKTYCFLGSSGVGKSSLINKLLKKDSIKTGSISKYSGRGKHVTTNRQMYFLQSGGIVIDNPGMREVGMADANLGIDSSFDEIFALADKCKFTDCAHINEPGCEVLLQLKLGKIDKDKYLNYISLKKESEHYELTQLDKRQKDRQFGKFLKTAKKEVKKYKP